MTKEPFLSVIVPVYNTGRFLERCMESLKKQTFGDMEIILVDDGSTDESPEICDAFAEQMENVRVIHKKNAGLGFARNSGLDMAEGTYVAFLDSDDYVDEDMYRKLVAEAVRTDADAVFCDYNVVRNSGLVETVKSNMEPGVYPGTAILRGMLGAEPEAKRDFDFDMSVWKGVYSRDCIEAHGIRFVSERSLISEDFIFNIVFLRQAEKVSYIRESLYYYCENIGSLTQRHIPDQLAKEKHIYLTVKQMLGDEIEDADWLRYDRLFLGRVRTSVMHEVKYNHAEDFWTKICTIRAIANDEMVRNIITSYPIDRNPIKLRIFNTFLRWRLCVGMYVLILLNQ